MFIPLLTLMLLTDSASPSPPIPIAHRGLLQHAPENTLPAFAACRALRCGIEVDVRRTKDGKLVCVHDDTLTRTTGRHAKVSETTWAEIQKLDAGSWFDPGFAREPVPSIEAVFQAESGNPLIALDLKIADKALPGELAALVKKHGNRDRVVCIGLAITDADLRKRLKLADPHLPIAVLAQTQADLAAAIQAPDSDWVYIRFVPSVQDVAAVHAAGKKVFAAGAFFSDREVKNWKQTATAGVDAVLTNFPLEMRQALKAKP